MDSSDFIAAAYVATALLLGGLILRTWLKACAVKAQLERMGHER